MSAELLFLIVFGCIAVQFLALAIYYNVKGTQSISDTVKPNKIQIED